MRSRAPILCTARGRGARDDETCAEPISPRPPRRFLLVFISAKKHYVVLKPMVEARGQRCTTRPGPWLALAQNPTAPKSHENVIEMVGMMISPLRMLALDSDVCPTPVTRTVAPLNTYTFLKCAVRPQSHLP
jgi:hypothetical protein